MEKFVILRRRDDGAWEHVGAQEVEIDEHEDVVPQVRATEQVGMAGVFVAVPFEDWVILEAEAHVTVKPVGRRVEVPREAMAADGVPRSDGLDERLLADDDSDMEGLTQGPKLR